MRAPLLVLALLVVAAWGQAAPRLVERDASVQGLLATRHELSTRFDVVATALEPAAASAPAVGTAEAPAEMTEAPTPAGTAVQRGHWTYAVTIRERNPDGAESGRFAIGLARDGRHVGTVYAAQEVPNPAAREGVRATFDIGVADPNAPLFVVTVREIVPGEIAHELRSAIRPDLQYEWRSPGGAVNPTLGARANVPLAITIVNADGTSLHNLQILQDGQTVAGPSEDIEGADDRATLRWTPPAAGTYRYECAYHASTMAGTLEVTP